MNDQKKSILTQAFALLFRKSDAKNVEQDIMAYYLTGKKDSETAEKMKMTVQTLRGKRQNMYSKIGHRLCRTIRDEIYFE